MPPTERRGWPRRPPVRRGTVSTGMKGTDLEVADPADRSTPTTANRAGESSSLMSRTFAPGGSLHGRDADLVGAVMAGGIAGLTGVFAIRSWLEAGRVEDSTIASLAGVPIYVMVIFGFLTRGPAVENPRQGEFLIPLASVVSPGVVLNLGQAFPAQWGTQLGYFIAAFGVALSVVTLAFLRRSFAVLPAVRAVVESGPYRFVRHPLYLGESFYVIGFVVLGVSWPGVAAVALMVGLLGWRILIEERKLRGRSDYQDYSRRVRFRLIPGLW